MSVSVGVRVRMRARANVSVIVNCMHWNVQIGMCERCVNVRDV